jgi:hypothetical protein
MASYSTFDITVSITLTGGNWRWFYRNKETLEPLSSYHYIKLEKSLTTLCFIPPLGIRENKEAVLYIDRWR